MKKQKPWLVFLLSFALFSSLLTACRGGMSAEERMGATVLMFAADIPEGTSKDDADDGVDATLEVLRQRLILQGFKEVIVAKVGENSIRVQIPGTEHPEKLTDFLGATAELTFRNADGEVVIKGSAVESAAVKYGIHDDSGTPGAYVELTFKPEERAKFQEATKNAAGRADGENYIAIYMDENGVSMPRVDASYADTGIDSDSCIISFGDIAEHPNAAREFADMVNIGRLPYAMMLIEKDVIEAR